MRTTMSLGTQRGSTIFLAILTLLPALLGACRDSTGVGRTPSPWLVFIRDSYDTLFVADPESGTIERTISLPMPASRFNFSPAGGRLATVSGAALWLMGQDGSAATRVAANVSNFAWSPDGRTIAYVRSSPHEIHLIDAGGTTDMILPGAVPGGFDGIAWSPDGTRIAFEGIRQMNPGATRTVYVVNVDGSGLRDVDAALAGPAERAAGEPTWSPDGQHLAMERYFRNSDGTGETKLWVITPATGDARRITSGVGDDVRPTWSPEGARITFLRFTGSATDVYVVNSDGTGLRRITETAAHEEEPHFLVRLER